MSRPKKKLSRNAEIVITCIITLALCVTGYVLSLLFNTSCTTVEEKRQTVLNGLNNLSNILPIISDGLSPSFILWCTIGIISNFSKSGYVKAAKISPTIAITAFVLYLIWYVAYLVLKAIFFEVFVINLGLLGIILVISFLFFN